MNQEFLGLDKQVEQLHNRYNLLSSMHIFHGGDVIFSRINPRKNRVTVVPQEIKEGLV